MWIEWAIRLMAVYRPFSGFHELFGKTQNLYEIAYIYKFLAIPDKPNSTPSTNRGQSPRIVEDMSPRKHGIGILTEILSIDRPVAWPKFD